MSASEKACSRDLAAVRARAALRARARAGLTAARAGARDGAARVGRAALGAASTRAGIRAGGSRRTRLRAATAGAVGIALRTRSAALHASALRAIGRRGRWADGGVNGPGLAVVRGVDGAGREHEGHGQRKELLHHERNDCAWRAGDNARQSAHCSVARDAPACRRHPKRASGDAPVPWFVWYETNQGPGAKRVCRGGKLRAYADDVLRASRLVVVAVFTCVALANGCSYDFTLGAPAPAAPAPDAGAGVDASSPDADASAPPASGTCNGSACVCPADQTCDLTCTSGSGCATRCEARTVCKTSCPGSGCGTSCGEGATCEVNCVGSGCGTRCAAGSTCSVVCLGGNCVIECEGGVCRFTYCPKGNCTCTGTGCQ